MRRVARALAILVVAGLLVANASADDRLPARTTSKGGVTVKAQPRALESAGWEFELTFDTHTQDLKDDPLNFATLVADTGKPLAPVDWKGDPPGGHHRKGVLRFGVVSPAPAQIELRLPRAGEAEPRVFRWKLR
jgi:hypothetical protein